MHLNVSENNMTLKLDLIYCCVASGWHYTKEKLS